MAVVACLNLIRSAWRNVTVEFYMFLFFLGYAFYTAASFPLFYSKVCLSMYDESVCNNLSSTPDIENEVQLASTEWTAYIELARFTPTLIGTMFLGSFGDHYSTKPPVLISLAFMVAYMSTYTALVSFPECPLYSIIIGSTILAMGGQMASFVTCLYSFLAKKVDDENRLTFRYAVLTAFWSFAYVVAGNIAPFLYALMSYQYVMVIGQAVLMVTFVLVLLFYPKEENELVVEEKNPTVGYPQIQNDHAFTEDGAHNGTQAVPTIQSPASTDSGYSSTDPERKNGNFLSAMCAENARLYQSAWRTITKSRPHCGRTFLVLLCLIGIIYGSQDAGLDAITSLFAYKTPLSWSPSLLAVWSAAMSLIQMTGSLISAYIFQRFKIANTWILLVGMCSACLKMLMISISTETWMMFVALALGCLSTVGFSALRALVVQLGTADETGELLGCLTATSSFVPVFSVLVYNTVYSATLNGFDGATFAVCAGLLAVCIISAILMHAYLKRVSQ